MAPFYYSFILASVLPPLDLDFLLETQLDQALLTVEDGVQTLMFEGDPSMAKAQQVLISIDQVETLLGSDVIHQIFFHR